MLRPLVLIATLFTALAALADAPAAQRVNVPRTQKPPVVDGLVHSSEWARAARVFLGNAGHALLLHDGRFLYIGFVGTRLGIGSICTSSAAGRVSVLQSSAQLATARFEKKGAIWERTRPFAMKWIASGDSQHAQAERKKFLTTEGWLASTYPDAVKQREFQIATGTRTEVPLVLSMLTFLSRAEYDLDAWPSPVYDGCVEMDLAVGSNEGTHTFEPESWGVAVLE